MEHIEKIAYPLMIAGAIASIYALMRRSNVVQTVSYARGESPAYINGSDPATVQGESNANVWTGLQRVNAAIAYPWSIASGTNAPVTVATPAPSASSGHHEGGCGCGGAKASSCGCLSPCDSGVRFVGGNGQCLAPETRIPTPSERMHNLIDLVYNANNYVSMPDSA